MLICIVVIGHVKKGFPTYQDQPVHLSSLIWKLHCLLTQANIIAEKLTVYLSDQIVRLRKLIWIYTVPDLSEDLFSHDASQFMIISF